MTSPRSLEPRPNGIPQASSTAEGELLRALVRFTGKQMLEIGGGDGRLTRHFAGYSRKTVLIDSDISELTTARQELSDTVPGRVALHNAKAEQLPYPPNSFDLVVFSWSL